MDLDRSSIQRTDFPTVRRGYESAAVDAHLREVADAVEDGGRAATAQPVAAAASAQVHHIIEAAENAAEQLRTEVLEQTEQQRIQAREEAERLRAEAGDEAREHVQRVSTAARELLERIGTLQQELGGILGRLHDDAGRLSSELQGLEQDVAELASPEEEVEPAAALAPLRAPDAEDGPELEIELVPPTGATRADDEEAARLVALDMALGGTPREETEKYLAQQYALSDADQLLDDVYTLAAS